jgi:hypothetical protein
MIFLEKISNVNIYKPSSNGVYFLDSQNNITNQFSKKHTFESPITGFQIFESILFINDWSGNYKIYDKDIEILEEGSGKGYFYSSVHFLGCQYTNESRIIDGLIDKNFCIHSFGTLNKIISTNISTSDKYFISSKTSIQSFLISGLKALWQFDLSPLGTYQPIRSTDNKPYEVIKFLGVCQSELIVACSNGLILCLDVNKGIEKRRFHTCSEYPLGSITYHHLNDANVFVYDEINELLFALHTYYYMEIKLSTGDITILNLREDMNNNGISFYRQNSGYAWDDTHIYTIADIAHHNSPVAKGDKCVVAVNRTAKRIEWKHVFENDSLNDVPQVSGDKLYQLTANKELYIFQKDN